MSQFPNGSLTAASMTLGAVTPSATRRKRTIVPSLPKIQPKKPPQEPEFSDIFTKTDINGFPDWYEAPNWSLKIAWTIILLAAITLLTLELIHTIRDFLDNPILTTYSFVNEPEGMKFPEVYLCPTNPIHRNQYTLSNVDGAWEEAHADGLLKALSNITGLAGLLKAKTTQSELLASNRPGSSFGGHQAAKRGPDVNVKQENENEEPPELWIPDKVEDYFKAVGYPVKTFIRECSFNGKPLNCSEIITEVFDADYGKCFLIKLNSYQTVGGVGMSVVLDLDFENGYPEGGKPQPFSDGVLLKVGEKVDAGISGSVQLMPASYTKVALSSRKMGLIDRTRLKKGSPQLCTDEKEVDEKLKVLKGEFFTMDSCIQDCHQVHVVKNCSCYLPVDGRFINDHILTNERMDICLPKVLKGCAADVLKEKQKEIEECTRGCNLPCNYWEYQMSLSASAFPSRNLKSFIVPPRGLHVNSEPAHFCSKLPNPPVRISQCPPQFLQTRPQLQFGFQPNAPPQTNQPVRFTEPNTTTLWYWNPTEEDCLPEEHHWCPPFDIEPSSWDFTFTSWFPTRMQCLNNCGYGNPCLALANFPNRKNGRKRNRYAYLLKEGRCRRYHGYGVLATENNFDTREQCDEKCNSTENDPCNIDSYNRCLVFGYNYYTYSEEQLACQWKQTAIMPADNCTLMPARNHYSNSSDCFINCIASNDLNNCTGPAFRGDGTCMEVERRYFHIPKIGVCKVFDYVGCPFAKGNAFKTKEECENKCVTSIVKPPGWKSKISHQNSTSNKGPKQEDIQGASKLNINPSKWSQGDMIVLDIAFSSLQYIELTQEHSMTFTTFVSNVGGQVGLWVGCSVVTIVKLFLVVMPLCLRCRKRSSLAERTENREP